MSVADKIKNAIPVVDDKKRNFIIGGILLAVFLLDYFLVMSPQLNILRKLNPKVTLLTEDIAQAKTDMQRMEEYQSEVRRLDEAVSALNQQIKTKEEVPFVLEEISRIANQFDVMIDQMMPLVTSAELLLENPDGKYYSLPILVEARTGYHGLGQFFNEIESKGDTLTIERFTFSGKENQRSAHSLKVTLRAVVLEEVKQ